MDLQQRDPVALAEAGLLYERLRGLAQPIIGGREGSEGMTLLTLHLEIAVWDGRLDFQLLAGPSELRGLGGEPKDSPSDIESPTKHWIELEIVDDETGEPVAGMRVSLKLPDGRSLEKTTNADGIIHVDGQPADVWTIVDVKDPVEVVAMVALSRD